MTFPAAREEDSFDPDNQRFLKNIQLRGRQAMIAESLARAQKDFDAFLEEKVDLNWEEQRQKIFQHFGLAQKDDAAGDRHARTMRGSFARSTKHPRHSGPPHDLPSASGRSVFGRSGLEKSIIGTPGPALTSKQLFDDGTERSDGLAASSSDSRFLREKMGYYAEKVQRLNSMRLQGQAYPILHEFAEVEKHGGMDVSRLGRYNCVCSY